MSKVTAFPVYENRRRALLPLGYNTPSLVAFTGPAGSGKSTAAEYLIAKHGFVRVRFAGPLKDMMRAIGLGEAEIEGHLKEVPSPILMGRTPRHAMQALGTEWGRDLIHPNFWISLWQRTACDVLDHGGRVVVDDCRFDNEAVALRSIGGVIYRLEDRGGISGGHVSEAQTVVADGIISNAGSVADLHGALDRLAEVRAVAA